MWAYFPIKKPVKLMIDTLPRVNQGEYIGHVITGDEISDDNDAARQ